MSSAAAAAASPQSIQVGDKGFQILSNIQGFETTVELVFANPLPDDRFTLTVEDAVTDPLCNALNGESNASEPNGSAHLVDLVEAVMNGPEAGNKDGADGLTLALLPREVGVSFHAAGETNNADNGCAGRRSGADR